MGRDKAALEYHGRSQLQWTLELVSEMCSASFVSVRPDQRDEPTRSAFPQVVDLRPGIGPIAGITAALQQHPKAAWLVVACDLPFITREVLANLIDRRDPQSLATAYRSHHDQLPEPLCAIWEPASREQLLSYVAAGKHCPRKFLINAHTRLVDLPDARALDNINTNDEHRVASAMLADAANGQKDLLKSSDSPPARAPSPEPAGSDQPLRLRIQYYALFREQAGRSEETLETSATTPNALYRELQSRYPFQLDQSQLKVAVNADFRDWNSPLASGDTVVFIPPVAGG
jgi:molybdopterin-guanine dinucleotide biosynthesis protein A